MAELRTGRLCWTSALMSCATLIAGCDTSTNEPTTSAASRSAASMSATSSREQPPSVTTSPSLTTPPTPVATVQGLVDGRYAARITAVDSNRRLVTVDVVQLDEHPPSLGQVEQPRSSLGRYRGSMFAVELGRTVLARSFNRPPFCGCNH